MENGKVWKPSEGNAKPFTLDQMMADCEYIRRFCSEGDKAATGLKIQLFEDSERLLKSAKFIHRVAPEFFFEGLPQNGFVTFLRIATAFTSKIVSQIEENRKVDPELLKIFAILFDCDAWLVDVYHDLKKEKEVLATTDPSVGQHLIKREFCLGSKHVHRLVK